MWEALVRRELRPLVDALKGKKTGYSDAIDQLERDPCLVHPPAPGETEGRPFAYRLSGALKPKVCGTHLRYEHRLAFSMRPPDHDDIEGIVEVLFVGTRDTRNRANDVWQIVHDLFGEENPPADHLQPPCCEGDLPEISEDEVLEFMSRLKVFLRGR